MQKKIFIIDKEILLTARNSDHSESDIEKKIFIILKESLNSRGNLINFHQKSIKVCHSRQKCIIRQKVHEFAQNFLATPKLSWN